MNRVQRLRRRRQKKWTMLIILGCLILFGLMIWYYILIQSPKWQERKEMQQIMLSQSNLTEIDQYYKFVTEHVYYVATGFDEREVPIFVALSEEGTIETFHPENGMHETDIVMQHEQQYPEAEIIRVQPGIWRGYWVWEIFSRQQEKAGRRASYHYYEMATGELLETYRLRLDR